MELFASIYFTTYGNLRSITRERRSKVSFLQKQRAVWGEAIISKPCTTRHLTEDEIKQIFVKALNSLVEVKENVIAEL